MLRSISPSNVFRQRWVQGCLAALALFLLWNAYSRVSLGRSLVLSDIRSVAYPSTPALPNQPEPARRQNLQPVAPAPSASSSSSELSASGVPDPLCDLGFVPAFTTQMRCMKASEMTEADTALAKTHDVSNMIGRFGLDFVYACVGTPEQTRGRDTLYVMMHRWWPGILEEEWVHHFAVKAMDRPALVFHDTTMNVIVDNTMIQACVQVPYGIFTRAKADGIKNVGIYHMGDETLTHGDHLYEGADYAFRNYQKTSLHMDPKFKDRVLWFPNGYRNGYGPIDFTLQRASQRPMNCYWSGSIRSDRQEMVNVLQQNKLDCDLLVTNGFGDGVSLEEYRGNMSSARFCLNPYGNSPETIRVYEALESGCMIIGRYHDTFPHIYGPSPPMTLVNEWRELPALFERIKRLSPERLDLMQCWQVQLWRSIKHETAMTARRMVDKSFEAAGYK